MRTMIVKPSSAAEGQPTTAKIADPYEDTTAPIEMQTEQLDQLTVVMPRQDTPTPGKPNEVATAIVRTFNPEHPEITGEAVFTGTTAEGTPADELTEEQETALLEAVNELTDQQNEGQTLSLTPATRTRLLQTFTPPQQEFSEDPLFTPEDEVEDEQPSQGVQDKGQLGWLLAALMGFITLVLLALLLFPFGTNSDDQSGEQVTQQEQLPPETVTETAEPEPVPFDTGQAAELDDRSRQLDERQTELDNREAELSNRDAQLADRETQLNTRESELDSIASNLDSRESIVSEQERELEERRTELNEAIEEYNRQIEENQEQEQQPETEEGNGLRIPMPGNNDDIVIPGR